MPRQTLEGGHFLAIAHPGLEHRITQDSDVLIVCTTVSRERMGIFPSVRIGIIGPLPPALLLFARFISRIAARSARSDKLRTVAPPTRPKPSKV